MGFGLRDHLFDPWGLNCFNCVEFCYSQTGIVVCVEIDCCTHNLTPIYV